MGFINSASTVTITARLTKIGREKLLYNSNTIFSHFILGDSDANYNTSEKLTTGKIPSNSGDLGGNNTTNDNINEGATIVSKLYVTIPPISKKTVESNSSTISTSITNIGETTLSGSNLTFVEIEKTNTSSEFTNYFKSLSLPITETSVNYFTGTTSGNGGWSDTSFSGLGASKILMAVIDNSQYGELIDGKSIKMTLPIATGFTTGGIVTGITSYDIYSTFPKTTIQKVDLDNSYEDKSTYSKSLFGNPINVSYLVCDDIQKPNNDSSKSWSTGYDSFKPFSLNGKELINVQTVASTGINSDKVVGVAYLDKGIIAITDQTIVENIAINFSGDSNTNTITNDLGLYYFTGNTYTTIVDSIQFDLVQNINCIAARGEFYNSQNETITVNDDVRISEIAITDVAGNILAIGKTDRQIIKKKNDFVIFDVQIII